MTTVSVLGIYEAVYVCLSGSCRKTALMSSSYLPSRPEYVGLEFKIKLLPIGLRFQFRDLSM